MLRLSAFGKCSLRCKIIAFGIAPAIYLLNFRQLLCICLLFFLPDQGSSASVVLITFGVQRFLGVGDSPVTVACLAASTAPRCLEGLFTIVTASNAPECLPQLRTIVPLCFQFKLCMLSSTRIYAAASYCSTERPDFSA